MTNRRRMLQWAVLLSEKAWLIGVAGTWITLLTVALSVLTITASRQRAIEHTHEAATSLTTVVRNDIARNFELYALSLLAIAEGAEDPEVLAAVPLMQRKVLFDRAITAEFLGGAYLLDANGNVALESKSSRPILLNLSDRDYFSVHKNNNRIGLFYSKPFASRASPGKWFVGMSRRANRPDGSFSNVALVTVSINYFVNVLEKINAGNQGLAAIIDTDGTLIARKPFILAEVGKDFSKSPVFKHIVGKNEGGFEETSTIDGINRFYNFARIPGTPWIVVIGTSETEALAEWKKQSLLTGILTTIFSLAFICLSWFFAYAVHHRAKAYKDLLSLANNDALTGLKSRRALDAHIEVEWRHALREKLAMSLLFIDIDYFKLYNDTYGHSSGDVALRAVADCIGGSFARPHDMAGRYGGEEFLVLLPSTGHEGALLVAEKIRAAVQDQALRHEASSYGVVTVSIGCATIHPNEQTSIIELVNDADKALYAAKASGRNRTRSGFSHEKKLDTPP